MIDIIFYYGTEIVFVRVQGNHVGFSSSSSGNMYATIEGLNLVRSGVIKEFPDLEGDSNWRQEAIKRFKEKIKSFNTEEEKAKYIIGDLSKFGYVPKYIQRAGFRKEGLS